MENNKNLKNGFTLVELLAVIVILAIILVIAVPKVMSVIEDSKKATLESTAKMIASTAEKAKVQNTVLGNDTQITCDSVAKINKLDYEDCDIEFDDNTAKVTIKGKGKFAGLNVCNGTKTEASATEESCNLCIGGEINVIKSINATKPYILKNKESCNTHLTNVAKNAGIYEMWSETINSLCNGVETESITFNDAINTLLNEGLTTEANLISNNVIEVSIETEKQCSTDAECFTYEDYTFIKDFDLNQTACTTYFSEKYGSSYDNTICLDDTGETARQEIFVNNIPADELVDAGVISNVVYDEGINITGYDTKCELNVKVPSSINNKPVISIDNWAFEESDVLIEELYLPSSILKVGKNAYQNYPVTLNTVWLENQSTHLGFCAFGHLEDLPINNLPINYECTDI